MTWVGLLVLGALLGAVGAALMHMASVARQRGSWAVAMVAIALFYVVFAFERADPSDIAVHALIAAAFAGMAVLGARASPWWIVAALAGHGLFDAAAHLIVADPSPDWWGPFCLGVDVALAAWLARLVRRGEIAPISSPA